MVIPSITSAIIAVIEGSWIASSIFLKYFLIGLIAKNFYQDSFTREEIVEDVVESSELVVPLLIVSGLFLTVSGLEVTPVLMLFSELAALGYFTVLFWKC
ncbi:hypothetical protein AQV86_00585 [Nanohaloarchaea archaeon SG9]|nr:hypothetical protein AQV86_00585 [Nanohaloarchaea archaeon SG9]